MLLLWGEGEAGGSSLTVLVAAPRTLSMVSFPSNTYPFTIFRLSEVGRLPVDMFTVNNGGAMTYLFFFLLDSWLSLYPIRDFYRLFTIVMDGRGIGLLVGCLRPLTGGYVRLPGAATLVFGGIEINGSSHELLLLFP